MWYEATLFPRFGNGLGARVHAFRRAEGVSCAGDDKDVDMSEQEQAEIRREFARLKQDHADFDAAIDAMIASGCDPLRIQRMKKKKLALKDRLKELEDRLIPDIIA